MKKVEIKRTRNHLYKGFQYGYAINYTIVENDVLHAMGISTYYLNDTIGYGAKSKRLQLNGNFDQFIFPLKMRVSLIYQFSSNRFYQSMNGNLGLLQLETSSFRVTFKSAWKKSIQYEWSETLERSTSNVMQHSVFLTNISTQLNLKYAINSKLHSGLQCNFMQTVKSRSYCFMDVIVQSKLTKNLNVTVSVLNLLDMISYQQRYVSNYGLQVFSTPLSGRRILLEFKWML